MSGLTITLTDDSADDLIVELEGTSTTPDAEIPMSPHEIYISFWLEASVASPLPSRGEDAPLLVSDLGWSREDAARVRGQLAAFEEDWDAPGMSAYDAL